MAKIEEEEKVIGIDQNIEIDDLLDDLLKKDGYPADAVEVGQARPGLKLHNLMREIVKECP